MDQIEIVKAEVMSIPEQAKALIIKDQNSFEKGNQIFLIIKGLRKKIAETMDPIISSAWKTHGIAVKQKKDLEAPLIIAENWLNGPMTNYKLEQDRIREAEERKLREEAIRVETERRRKEEEQRMAEAAALEAAGKKEEAEQMMVEAIQAKEEPITVKVVPITPKIELNGTSMQTNWTFEIVNEALIPRQYMVPDMVKIGGIVRSLKEQANIAGIRVYSKTKMKSTGR